MKAVGIRELKDKLSRFLDEVRRGDVILVTDRDEVVAELVPPSASRSNEIADALLAEGVRQGWIRPALLPQRGAPPRRTITTFKRLMKELERDRSDR